MKILCCYLFEWEKEYFKKKLPGYDLVFVHGTTRNCPKKPDPSIEVLCVFIDSPVTASFMAQFSHLKFIATRSTGVDHIDLQTAKKNNIIVSYVPAYGKCAVSEYTMGLLLSLSRKIYHARDITRAGRFFAGELVGFDLQGKTLGVVGTGAIGSRVAQLAKAFGMNVVACDPNPNQALAAELGFLYVSFQDLLIQSDIVTLHVAYNKSTHHLINRTNIGNMRRGSCLINTARGPVIETMALVQALDEEILAGVALDVFEEEAAMADESALLLDKHAIADKLQTVLANHYLARHPRALLSPHNAYNSIEACKCTWDVAVENIESFMAGSPTHLVAHD